MYCENDDMWKCHKRISMFPTMLAMHALQHLIMDLQTRLNKPWLCWISRAAQMIQLDLFKNPRVLRTKHFSLHPKDKNPFCWNQESEVARKPVHLAQSIVDQTPDSNVHELICHNGVVPYHVENTYDLMNNATKCRTKTFPTNPCNFSYLLLKFFPIILGHPVLIIHNFLANFPYMV